MQSNVTSTEEGSKSQYHDTVSSTSTVHKLFKKNDDLPNYLKLVTAKDDVQHLALVFENDQDIYEYINVDNDDIDDTKAKMNACQDFMTGKSLSIVFVIGDGDSSNRWACVRTDNGDKEESDQNEIEVLHSVHTVTVDKLPEALQRLYHDLRINLVSQFESGIHKIDVIERMHGTESNSKRRFKVKLELESNRYLSAVVEGDPSLRLLGPDRENLSDNDFKARAERALSYLNSVQLRGKFQNNEGETCLRELICSVSSEKVMIKNIHCPFVSNDESDEGDCADFSHLFPTLDKLNELEDLNGNIWIYRSDENCLVAITNKSGLLPTKTVVADDEMFKSFSDVGYEWVPLSVETGESRQVKVYHLYSMDSQCKAKLVFFNKDMLNKRSNKRSRGSKSSNADIINKWFQDLGFTSNKNPYSGREVFGVVKICPVDQKHRVTFNLPTSDTYALGLQSCYNQKRVVSDHLLFDKPFHLKIKKGNCRLLSALRSTHNGDETFHIALLKNLILVELLCALKSEWNYDHVIEKFGLPRVRQFFETVDGQRVEDDGTFEDSLKECFKFVCDVRQRVNAQDVTNLEKFICALLGKRQNQSGRSGPTKSSSFRFMIGNSIAEPLLVRKTDQEKYTNADYSLLHSMHFSDEAIAKNVTKLLEYPEETEKEWTTLGSKTAVNITTREDCAKESLKLMEGLNLLQEKLLDQKLPSHHISISDLKDKVRNEIKFIEVQNCVGNVHEQAIKSSEGTYLAIHTPRGNKSSKKHCVLIEDGKISDPVDEGHGKRLAINPDTLRKLRITKIEELYKITRVNLNSKTMKSLEQSVK